MFIIAKREETKRLEREIYSATQKQGVFGCFEVTIGWFGEERVDYMTYDTKGIWRCYEIKVSKADFYSNAKKTFVGHYNYFVVTNELFEKVKDEIPTEIGIYVGKICKRRAKKLKLTIDEQILKNSMIRSLSRDADKLLKSNNPDFLESMKRRLNYERIEKEKYRGQYQSLMREVREKYGIGWRNSD